MSDLILHHYPQSPFAEKIRLILGYKKLSWQSVLAPMIMPKPKQYSKFTANGANAQSREGRMVLFPSWLRHNVPSNSQGDERISIAFNLMFKNFAETLAAPMWDPSAGVGKK